jgi:DNA-binding XRE family transcriptional regulator
MRVIAKCIRFKETTMKWVEKKAKELGVKPTTMIRIMIEREEQKEKLEKRLER